MHELPVAESVLKIALRHAEREHAVRVTDLYLVIGQLSSIVDDSVQFYWDIISQGTIAEAATLHFERVPMQMLCLECSRTYRPASGTLDCPHCGSPRVQVTRGDEFQLESIGIERSEDTPRTEAVPGP